VGDLADPRAAIYYRGVRFSCSFPVQYAKVSLMCLCVVSSSKLHRSEKTWKKGDMGWKRMIKGGGA
jgi:hypothetical protein